MKKHLIFLFFGTLILQKNFSQSPEVKKTWQYPFIKQDTVSDFYFGKKVIDPYRYFENTNNEIVSAWVKNQNELYDTIIHNITCRDSLKKELFQMKIRRKNWADYPKVAGSRIFYPMGFVDDHDIERLVYIDSTLKEPIELFNTKEINEKDKSVYNFNYYEPSYNGKYIAIGISPNGNEKARIFIIDVEKKQLLQEVIEQSQFGNIQWIPDGTGFFYLQGKEIITDEDKRTPYEDSKVFFHKLNTEPRNDKKICARSLNKDLVLAKNDWPMLFIYPSSQKVLLNILNGSYCAVYYSCLEDLLNKPSENITWTKICGSEDKMSNNVLCDDKFFGLSNKLNPDGQVIMMKLPDLNSTVLYDAKGFTLDDMVLTDNGIYLTTIEKGVNKLARINTKDYSIKNIDLPYLGGLRMRPSFSINSFYQPTDNLIFTLTGYDKQWGEYIYDDNKKVHKIDIFPEVQYTNPPFDLVVEEIEAHSFDGAMVPLSIIYKKGLKFDGTCPTIIDAYGAFGISQKPNFSKNRLVWFNHGGIFAVAHVRGGGEKGDNWYKGGFKATKPNSWKDLIACAEYLIQNKYTSTKNLAVAGSSAGGIAVGRAITERPDLFKAAVIYVGTLNTIRMENTTNNSTIPEFGTVKDSIEFQYLYNMDTYHHIYKGIDYPSVLFTASLNDARVPTWQPAKAVAKMQDVSKGNNIVLFRIEDNGHFDYPSDTDIYSFLFWQLGNPNFKLKENNFMFKPISH